MPADADATAPESPPRPPPVEWARLETPGLTAAFWGAVGIFALAFWLTPFPPCVDYPQHLALGALVHRLLIPGSPEHADYVFTPLTYNGSLHLAVALLSFVVPTEAAGKILLSLIPILTGSAGLAVMRVAERPRWYAAFLLPFSFSYIVGWGFVNYALGAALGLHAIAWWFRWRDGERRLLPWVMGTALLLSYTHVLAMLCFCISIAVATLAWQLPREVGVRRWLLGLVTAPLPLVPAAVYSVVVFLAHRAAPHIYWEPQKDGTDAPAWSKIYDLTSYAIANLGDSSDRVLFLVALALLVTLWLSSTFVPRIGPAPRRELVALAGTWFLLYLVTPRVFMSTWWIFERLPLWWMVFLVAITPVAPTIVSQWVRPALAAGMVLLSLSTARALATIPDARDADAIIDDIPEGSRVIAVMHSYHGYPAVWRELWVHHLAYYLVRRRGEIAFDFTRYASLPVRPRNAGVPPRFPSGLEWLPDRYDPTAAYAEYFHLVLVRTPDDAPHDDPRARTFGAYAPLVIERAHRGRFWLFDTRPIHEVTAPVWP